jgi:general secretion pathway protein I
LRNPRKTYRRQAETGRRKLVCGGGFTLLETLVAMMLLAVSMTILLQIFSGGLRAATASEDHTRAVFHARERMEALLFTPPEEGEGTTSGRFDDGYTWHAVYDRATLPAVFPESAKEFVRLTVTVGWTDAGRSKTYRLRTLISQEQLGTNLQIDSM